MEASRTTSEASGEAPERAGGVHPPILSILDALTFRLARLNAVNERSGSHFFGQSHGVSLGQWRILGLVAALGGADGGRASRSVSSRDVRATLYMDKGQFSRTVAQLVERNLLNSDASTQDARTTELRLTRRGRALHDRLLRFTAERNEAVVSVLTPAECESFLDLLDRLGAHSEAVQREAGILP